MFRARRRSECDESSNVSTPESYRGEPFVRVPPKRLPEVVAVSGSNHAEVGVVVGDASDGKRLVTAFAATDNLIKGGAGQAIQSMNIMFGFDERASLEIPAGTRR